MTECPLAEKTRYLGLSKGKIDSISCVYSMTPWHITKVKENRDPPPPGGALPSPHLNLVLNLEGEVNFQELGVFESLTPCVTSRFEV